MQYPTPLRAKANDQNFIDLSSYSEEIIAEEF
jgi:hypothetical protein